MLDGVWDDLLDGSGDIEFVAGGAVEKPGLGVNGIKEVILLALLVWPRPPWTEDPSSHSELQSQLSSADMDEVCASDNDEDAETDSGPSSISQSMDSQSGLGVPPLRTEATAVQYPNKK